MWTIDGRVNVLINVTVNVPINRAASTKIARGWDVVDTLNSVKKFEHPYPSSLYIIVAPELQINN